MRKDLLDIIEADIKRQIDELDKELNDPKNFKTHDDWKRVSVIREVETDEANV